MLTERERRWLEEEAQDTLGLTTLRAKVLVAALDREHYSIRELGRLTNLDAEAVRLAIEVLTARDLLEVRATGVRRQGYHTVPGRRLRFLLDAVLAAQDQQAQTSRDA